VAKSYRIHPAIGVARVGNSPSEFYIAPETIGGLPLACTADGEPVSNGGQPEYVTRFKDDEGRVKRQAARFRVLEYDSDRPNAPGREVRPGKNNVQGIRWTAHIANKKAAWWNFAEQAGDLVYGEWNSYENQVNDPLIDKTPWAVTLRNASVKEKKRQATLIVDPGPRTVTKASPTAVFDDQTPYRFKSFPPKDLMPAPITSLGNLIMDSAGRLLVLGGFGTACGPSFNFASFAGADGWYDDVSDGPVTATVELADGGSVEAELAWVLVGSPKFAPELVNLVTLDDLIYDTSIREMDFDPRIFRKDWNRSYRPNFDRDIKPILERPAGYRWVSTTPFLNSFSPPPFDARDASEENRANRENYLKYFRKPVPAQRFRNEKAAAKALKTPHGPASAFGDGGAVGEGIPLMPVNSGSNPLNQELIIKFLTLTPTQYFFLEQWAAGRFDAGPEPRPAQRSVLAEDRAGPGNCVGGPLCPGIETTWIMHNPKIYASPYRIKAAHPESYYEEHGLSTTNDEGRGGGCEPGDLTKRMAIPWQADFYHCDVQYVNFSDPDVNKDASDNTPIPPTMFLYWWPPQSPEFTMVDDRDPATQLQSGLSVGMQAPYARGINSIAQMILAWHYLAFIANQNRRDPLFPYFVEQERSDDKFAVGVVGLGQVDVMGGKYGTNPAGRYVPFWYLLENVPVK